MVAQIFGSYIACLLVYVQYKQLIHVRIFPYSTCLSSSTKVLTGVLQTAINGLKLAGLYDSLMFTPNGPGGIFGLYVTPGSNLGYVVLNEFVCDFILGVCVFGVLDPSNHLATPTTMPWLIALA